jgi:TM2 domain-containing membrane protein YozV
VAAEGWIADLSGNAGARRSHRKDAPNRRESLVIAFIVALILAIVGIVQLFQGQILWGIILLVAAALVGPGGYSLFRNRSA